MLCAAHAHGARSSPVLFAFEYRHPKRSDEHEKKETENTSLALQMMLIILSNLCAERDRAKENRMKCVSSSVLLIRMPHNGHTRTATTVTQAYIWSIDGRDCRTNWLKCTSQSSTLDSARDVTVKAHPNALTHTYIRTTPTGTRIVRNSAIWIDKMLSPTLARALSQVLVGFANETDKRARKIQKSVSFDKNYPKWLHAHAPQIICH